MKKLCIVMQDDGSIMVGLEPQGEETAEATPGAAMQDDSSYLSPVSSLEEAFSVGKDLLASDQAQEAENAKSFEGGYQKAGGPMGMEGLSTKGMA